MTKAVAIIVAVLFVLSSNFLSVAVSAADYNKIDISDYVSGRDFVGNDVIVSYDLPLDPWTEMYGFATGSNTPLLIDSYRGNFFFFQDSIDGIFADFDLWYSFDLEGVRFGNSYGTQFQEYFVPEDLFYYCDWLYISYLNANGGRVHEYAMIEWRQWAPGQTDLVGSVVTREGHAIDFVFNTREIDGEFMWDLYFGELLYLGFCEQTVWEEEALYQRINGNMFPLGKTNGSINMIDVSDIRSGYGFTLSFDLSFTTYHDSETELDGNAGTFDAVWLDKNFEEVDRSQYLIDLAPYTDYETWQFNIDFTVPDGAAYFYLRQNTGYFSVNTAYEFIWDFKNLSMTTTLSSIEENSQTMQKVQQKLEKLDEQLGDIKDELTPTPEQNDKAEQLEQEIGNASDKLENNNSMLEDLTPTRPEINTDLTLDEEKLFAVSPLITNIWSLSGMQGHIGIVLLVATVAYIFFGKRDS